MRSWVTLLRGVNVGGKNGGRVTVRSADLAACLRTAGLTDVVTVLATGNAVFTADDARDADDLKLTIQTALGEEFGYQAWVIVRSVEDVAGMAAAYPFARRDATHHPYLVFVGQDDVLTDLMSRTCEVTQESTPGGEQVQVGAGVLYWECPKGSSTDTPVARVLASARYRPSTTTRNLRTVEAIGAAARRTSGTTPTARAGGQ